MATLSPSRGEVWWYERSEQKPRPVLVITRNEAIDKLYEILVVPATRTVRGIATEVAIDREDGMPDACALSLDNTFLARKALLTERITELGPERMHEVCRALSAATDC
jgi:mRNA interferase MazF